MYTENRVFDFFMETSKWIQLKSTINRVINSAGILENKRVNIAERNKSSKQ